MLDAFLITVVLGTVLAWAYALWRHGHGKPVPLLGAARRRRERPRPVPLVPDGWTIEEWAAYGVRDLRVMLMQAARNWQKPS